MPRLSLGLGVQTIRKVGGGAPFSPADLTGLALWLKADAGVTTSTITPTYISQIVISGAGESSSDGTYQRSSGGNTSFTSGDNAIQGGGSTWYLYNAILEANAYVNYNSLEPNSWEEYDSTGAPSAVNTTSSGTPYTGASAWADQSGNGNNASANSGQEPTFISSFSNSKPAIEFNGTTQIMQIADANSLDFLATSLFIVIKYIGQGTGNNIVYFKNANAGNPEGQAMYGLVATNGGLVSFSQNVGGWSDYQTSIDITDSVAKILSMTYNGTDQNVYSNGSFSNTFSIGGNIATSTGLFQIGGYNQSFNAAEYFYGRIAEIIMYNRAVNGTERQQVETYLNTKYAIY